MSAQRVVEKVPAVVPNAARVGRMRAVLLYTVILGLAAGVPPRRVSAQNESSPVTKWNGKVTYKEVASSPKGHRVKTAEARFELSTLQASPTDFNEDNSWRNVTIAYADSGRWHRDESEIDEWSGPETDFWWNISDTLNIPMARYNEPPPHELRTKLSAASVSEVKLPVLPVYGVGSTVLVQPPNVGMLLDATYTHGQKTLTPGQGEGTSDLRVTVFVRQPAQSPEEFVPEGEASSGEYEGLTPEIAAAMKMMEAMSGDSDGDLDDDQITVMNLKMSGYVEFDGNPVTGSREWISTNENPGEYTSSLLDTLTTVEHRLTWEFKPITGK